MSPRNWWVLRLGNPHHKFLPARRARTAFSPGRRREAPDYRGEAPALTP
jgi:hypothetical protein